MTGPETAPARRILTVCLGNHCRSPFAAAVLASHGGPAVEVRSAGIRNKWVGHPAHPAMVTEAAHRGYDLTAHLGVQISPALVAWADLILAMDHANLHALRDLRGVSARLALYLGNRDVPDPWGKDEQEFAACADLIEAGTTRHLP